jgi:hypothetical protein
MSASDAPALAEVCVEVGGIRHEGVFGVDAGVLTVWYHSTAQSAQLRPGQPRLQAERLLLEMVKRGGDPAPQD